MVDFVTVSGVDELEKERVNRAFDVRGATIAVANVAGTFYAFDDTCTHLQCSLAGGDLEGGGRDLRLRTAPKGST